MTKSDFKYEINIYKELNSFIKEAFQKEYPDEEFIYFYILEGKIKVFAKSGSFDLTSNILSSLFDDIIF